MKNTDVKTPANKQKGKKTCTCCHKEKNLVDYYYSASSMYSLDERIPICKECCKTSCVNEDGTINYKKFKETLMHTDKPLYYDSLKSAEQSVKKENSFLSDDEVKYHGYDVLQKYYTLIAMRQDRATSFIDSQKQGYVHQNSNRSESDIIEIVKQYGMLFGEDSITIGGFVTENKDRLIKNITIEKEYYESKKQEEPVIYSDKWLGNYSESDIARLDHYYESLDQDYNIVTENHRDYARKIAKASLQMDKAFDDMINGVEGADKKYDNATKAFDLLSKSAKFSESTRSVNDVGASSFSKVAAMVESHNWIPEHVPLEKDVIDKLIDYLGTITKSI